MKEIKLTKGYSAFVDDEDFEELNKHKWYVRIGKNTNYAERTDYSGKIHKTISMHRVINKTIKPNVVDHIDGNGLNNTKQNLRNCSILENTFNRNKNKNCSSNYIGVSYYKKINKYKAQIQYKGKKIYIGLYETEIDAAKYRDIKSIELFGKFAKLNF